MLDTNVLVSAALFPSAHMKRFLDHIILNSHIILCSYVLDELYDVVRRKFPNKRREIELFLFKFPFTLVHTPEINLLEMDITIDDEDDFPVIMSAIIFDVDILITGDKHFGDVDIDRPTILTPGEYMKMF